MRRTLWLLAVVSVVIVGVGTWAGMRDRARPSAHPPEGKGCRAQTSDGTLDLHPEQMANAATIAAVGLTRGIPDRGIVIALATAMQESQLYNLDFGDRDSLGLFQQRPSQGWGSPEKILDPRYAARAFYISLQRVPGWESMRLTEAAQAVQRSAFPEAYQKWADDAQLLGEALVGDHATAITCTRVAEPTLRGAAAAEALAAGLQADWGRAATMREGALSLSVTASHDRGGWQLAHWLVAHSVDQNVSRVRFSGYEWTVDRGEWTQIGTPDESSPVVVADVPPAG